MTDSLITLTIHKYHPEWEPPDDNGREWISCLCPFHGDSNKSASVSFKNNAFRCFACPVRGDAIALIRSREGVTFAEAKKVVEGLGGVVQPSADKSYKLPRTNLLGNRGVAPRTRVGGSVRSIKLGED
ncbi:CHC2 zinc finger domain-containing protein [Mycobacterium paragordonae]|uniref:CHC2 zinc finger domain-containing protein n=1 Tax=Mycobacterium paragordonae TaxID=1389713 RepID=UPI00351BDA34